MYQNSVAPYSRIQAYSLKSVEETEWKQTRMSRLKSSMYVILLVELWDSPER